MFAFCRAFRIYDDDHSRHTLNFDEFKTGLQDYGVTLMSLKLVLYEQHFHITLLFPFDAKK